MSTCESISSFRDPSISSSAYGFFGVSLLCTSATSAFADRFVVLNRDGRFSLGESAVVNQKEDKSLLDAEFGKEFLTSWKSLSVTEDDAVDFIIDTVGKGKTKKFNFDKLLDGFNLDSPMTEGEQGGKKVIGGKGRSSEMGLKTRLPEAIPDCEDNAMIMFNQCASWVHQIFK